MKLTVLTDNTTRIDAYYLGEPGVSYYIEDGDRRILFDTGYSQVYTLNAMKMRIDLTKVDTVVLSHGHDDHTGGLQYYPKWDNHPTMIAHPAVFSPKRDENGRSIGSPMDIADACDRFILRLSDKPIDISEHLTFLGEIPRRNDFENEKAIGERQDDDSWVPDDLPDDSALVYRGKDGLTIITGCSHAGICNIVEYAKEVCHDQRIVGIIGGFHMLEMTDRVAKTAEYLKKQSPRHLCPCHCTCFHARAAIQAAVPTEEVCVGDVLEIE